MHKCGEERRRLAAEWAEFFAQQKLSKERAEREVERALQVDAQREGTLISLAKVEPRAASPAPSFRSSRCAPPSGWVSLAKGTATMIIIVTTPFYCPRALRTLLIQSSSHFHGLDIKNGFREAEPRGEGSTEAWPWASLTGSGTPFPHPLLPESGSDGAKAMRRAGQGLLEP